MVTNKNIKYFSKGGVDVLKRLTAFIAIMLLLMVIISSCSSEVKYGNHLDVASIEDENKMLSTHTSQQVKKVEIDSSLAKTGSVKIVYLDTSLKSVTVYVVHDYEKCNGYVINDLSEDTVLSLTYGKGVYIVEVKTINELGKEISLAEEEIVLDKDSQYLPFIIPTYVVKYEDDMEVIQKCKTMNEDCINDFEKVANIYNFVLDSLYYEEDPKKDYASWEYYPNIDEIYFAGKGVCVDYATMFAAICRSQRIPCKLITGNTGTGDSLHVWVEVYISDQGIYEYENLELWGESWNKIDLTLDDAKLEGETNLILPNYYEEISID